MIVFHFSTYIIFAYFAIRIINLTNSKSCIIFAVEKQKITNKNTE